MKSKSTIEIKHLEWTARNTQSLLNAVNDVIVLHSRGAASTPLVMSVLERCRDALTAAMGAGAEDPRWQKLRNLFGLDGWHEGLWIGIPNPDQIVNHVEHIANERARLLKAHIDGQPEATIGAGGQPVASEEIGWLIEHGGSDKPIYWQGGGKWSDNHETAIRFAREQDAATIALRLSFERGEELPPHKAIEHAWSGVRVLSTLSQPHPADERVVEALTKARETFETIAECAANCIHSPGQATNRSLAQYGAAVISAALSAKEGR